MRTRTRRYLCAVLLGAAVAAARPAAAPQAGGAPRPTLLITSCGQSSDGLTISLFGKRARLEHLYNPMAQARDLAGIRTLVVVIGGSIKGLAEVGTDEGSELARIADLLGAARQAGIQIIGAHVGGEARRGAVSDPFIDAVLPRVDAIVVTEAGNRDGRFSRASRSRQLPLIIVAQPAEVVRELQALRARAARQDP